MDVASPPLPAEAEPPAPEPRAKPGRRLLLHAAWVLVLALATEFRVGRFGFHPSDQGFILAQAWRVLHGEIPHTDIISARPLGSAILHVVDFVVPGPLFFVSSVLSMIEIIVSTMAFTVLLTRRRVRDWGPGLTALVAAASLINLNGFPLMAWHTVDGIALVACGAWALDCGFRSGRAFPRRSGLFLIGCAVFVKQSFVLAAVIGVLWLLLHPSLRDGMFSRLRWWRRTLADLLALGAFPLAYVGVVMATGGFPAMVDQLTGGTPAYGERLLGLWMADGADPTFVDPPLPELAIFAVAAAILCALRLFAGRPAGEKWAWAGRLAPWLFVLGCGAAVLSTVVDGEFTGPSRWADVLWWSAAIAVVANAVTRRRVPWAGLLVLATGFMISLSWGNDTPTLLTGTLALTALVLLADGMPPPFAWPSQLSLWPLTAIAGLALVVLAGQQVVYRHDQHAYLDVAHDQLTEDLGKVIPDMRGIRTNPNTFAYVSQIRDCVTRFPAKRTAVLPDNTFAYPALRLQNPFPLEWPLPLETVADAPERMLATADELNRDGDYLVLFQTVPRDVLAAGGPVPSKVTPDTPIFDYLGLEQAIQARLTGPVVTCGSFVGKWVPGR